MSDRQWAGMLLGDEAYAGSRNFYRLEASVRKHYGYANMLPLHPVCGPTMRTWCGP
jgi:tyrosine phenol-lyase